MQEALSSPKQLRGARSHYPFWIACHTELIPPTHQRASIGIPVRTAYLGLLLLENHGPYVGFACCLLSGGEGNATGAHSSLFPRIGIRNNSEMCNSRALGLAQRGENFQAEAAQDKVVRTNAG
ncbi:hypothetical protein V2G26_019668 [Clonostachys chloroleuca]